MFFPIFLKILIFWVCRWVKGQKMVQNDKKLCLLHSISQEPYIWFSFMVQMCKMIISSGVFFFNVKILIYQFVKGLKGQKMAQNVENFCLLHLIFQEPLSCALHLWYTCMFKRIISPVFFLIFSQNFDIQDH